MIRIGVPRVEIKKSPSVRMFAFRLTPGRGVTKSQGPVISKLVMPRRIFLIKDEFLAGSENHIQQDLGHTRLLQISAEMFLLLFLLFRIDQPIR
jgi:hypothetical protein